MELGSILTSFFVWVFFFVLVLVFSHRRDISIYCCVSVRLIYIEYCNEQEKNFGFLDCEQQKNLGGFFLVHNPIQ